MNLTYFPDERQIFNEVGYDPCKVSCDNNLINNLKAPLAKNIVMLSLMKNQLERFDFSLMPPRIRELQLTSNKISKIITNQTMTLASLRVLDLSQNMITDVDPLLASVALPKLKTLDLSSNRI